jgi:hypothetical protein
MIMDKKAQAEFETALDEAKVFTYAFERSMMDEPPVDKLDIIIQLLKSIDKKIK